MAFLALLGSVGAASGQAEDRPVQVEILTELGSITVEVYPEQAPNTVANFLRYVDGNLYDNGSFHRTVHDGQSAERLGSYRGDPGRHGPEPPWRRVGVHRP